MMQLYTFESKENVDLPYVKGYSYVKYDEESNTSSGTVPKFMEFCISDQCKLNDDRVSLDYCLSSLNLVSIEEIP